MKNQNNWGFAPFLIACPDGTKLKISVSGRVRWALQELARAGKRGCTPIDTPGPRWSAYVHILRSLGVPIKTVREQHGGPFKGAHARYVLCATAIMKKGNSE